MRNIEELRANGFIVRKSRDDEAFGCTVVEYFEKFHYFNPAAVPHKGYYTLKPSHMFKDGDGRELHRMIIAGTASTGELPFSILFGDAMTELRSAEEQLEQNEAELQKLKAQYEALMAEAKKKYDGSMNRVLSILAHK